MKSQRLIIEGGNALSGEIKVQGAKNSSLPIIAASLMCKGETVLKIVLALQILMRRAEYLRILDAHVVLKEIP